MIKSAATCNQPCNLTTFKMVGKMRISDFYDCLDSYFASGVTPLTLWNLINADMAAITTDEICAFAHSIGYLDQVRNGGKTAIVVDTPFDFGLARMFETQLEIAGLSLEMHVCFSLDEGKKWLGIDEALTTKLTIHKIGSCIQKTETGKLDRVRSLNLIHEISAAIQCHKNQNILVDLRDADVQSDMLDLMSFAAECAKYGSDFNKKIAILIPNTQERIETARLFKSCMDVMGFRLRQFFDYEAAIEWLLNSALGIRSTSGSIQKAS